MQVVVKTRLEEKAYQELVKQLQGSAVPFVTGTTTREQAGFMLGVQFALQKLREGYVVPNS